MGNCQNIPNDDAKSTSTKSKNKSQSALKSPFCSNTPKTFANRLVIRSSTWHRESHGLFDYESKTLINKDFKTNLSGRLVRTGDDIQWKKETQSVKVPRKSEELELLKVLHKEGVYWLMPPVEQNKPKDSKEPSEEGLWVVIKSLKQGNPDNKGYKLSEGEFVKIGRVRFRIKELKIAAGQDSKKKKDSGAKKEEIGSVALEDRRGSVSGSLTSVNQKANPIACKICLAEGTDSTVGPLISPCLCAGTMKYVHLMCLQKWLQSRLQVKKNGNATSYHWKAFECELCKHPYPPQLEAENKKYELVDIPKPESGAYIVLEILEKDSNQPKGVYLISMESKSSVRMGRGHDSDIRISDISVSRCHAMIRMDKGSFYLEDNDSKFGTLVYIQKPIAVADEFKNVSIQVGRSVLNLSLRTSKKAPISCFTSSKVQTDDDEISEGEMHDALDYDSPDEQAGSPQGNNNIHNDSMEGVQRDSEDERDEQEIVEAHIAAARDP